jgi:hypothetical protein
VQYSTVLMFSIVTAGMLGGVASYVGSGAKPESVGAAIHEAKATVRDTMRDLDGAYYRRGEAYEACATAYGGRMAGKLANGDITLSCECFDKSMQMLGGHDRETALKALGPGTGASQASAGKFKITATAGRVLRHCDIKPWTGGPTMPVSSPSIVTITARTPDGDTIAASGPRLDGEPSPMTGGLRGSF